MKIYSSSMNPNHRSPQTEKLLKVLDQTPNRFESKIYQYINNKIKYLYIRRDNVTPTVLIELFYIAKKRPEAFKSDSIINYLSNECEIPLPKGLATTLFMIYGKIYQGKGRPPILMASLLFKDVMGGREFCYFERAKNYIQGIQLLYFTGPSLLSPKIKEQLCKYWHIPINYHQWDSKIDTELRAIQGNVREEIRKISKEHPNDPHYADLLYFFMAFPEAQNIFIDEFPFLSRTFPQYIPSLFQAVTSLLLYSNPQNSNVEQFARRYAQLNPQICVEEHRRSLSEIIKEQQEFYSFITNPQISQYSSSSMVQNDMSNLQGALPIHQMQMGMAQRFNSNDQMVQRLIVILQSPRFHDELQRLRDDFGAEHTRPPLAFACNLLKNFLHAIQLQSQEEVVRVSQIFECILKYTRYSTNPNPIFLDPNIDYKELADLIFSYVQAISSSSQSFLSFLSENVLVPLPLKEQGLPFKQEALRLLVPDSVELPKLRRLAFVMIAAAAKYQYNCIRSKAAKQLEYPVIGNSISEIAKNIIAICQRSTINDATKVVSLGCLLLVVSPSDIGAKLTHCQDSIMEVFLEFLRKFLERNPENLVNDIDFESAIEDTNGMHAFIDKAAHLRYLSCDPLFQCRVPNYLDLLFRHEDFSDIVNRPPLYMLTIKKPDLIELLDFNEQAKYIFAHLVSMAMERDNVLVSEIYTNPCIIFWAQLLTSKRPKDITEQLKFYVKFLDPEKIHSRPIRVATFVMILLLNSEFIYQKNEFTQNLSSEGNQAITIIYQDINPNTLINPAQSRKIFTSDSQIVFKFFLPDDSKIARILSANLYIDNEVEMLNAFIQYLAYGPYAQDSLLPFVRKMPLLASCLQESCLAKYIEKPNFSYEMSYAPNYNYPNFSNSLSVGTKSGNPKNYHDIDVNLLEKTDVPAEQYVANLLEKDILQPAEDSELNVNNEEIHTTHFNFSSDEIENEVYRYEYILYTGGSLPRGPELKSTIRSNYYETVSEWKALASLKRLVLQHQKAFLLYAKPTLDIVDTEFKHFNDLTKKLINRLLSLLVISYIKFTHPTSSLTEEECQFLNSQLFPKLKEISELKELQKDNLNPDIPQILLPLLYAVLNTFNTNSTTQSSQILLDNLSMTKQTSPDLQLNIFSYIVPINLTWSVFEKELNDEDIAEIAIKEKKLTEKDVNDRKDDSKIVNQIQQSIILSTDEYPSQWLTHISLLPSLNFKNENFINNLLIPLILSSSQTAIDDFFQKLKMQDSEATIQLFNRISFYSPNVLPQYQTA